MLFYEWEEDENNMNQRKEQNKVTNKKVVTQIVAVVLFVVILILSLITIASSVKAKNLAFLRYRYYIMRSKSQPEIARVGDLVIAKKLDNGHIQVGDNIVYGDGKFYYCDEIVQSKKMNTTTKIIIAEKDGVRYQFSESEIEGKIVKTIPQLGDIIAFMRTPIRNGIFYNICNLLFCIVKNTDT